MPSPIRWASSSVRSAISVLEPDARMKMKKVTRNTKNSGPMVPMPDDVKVYLEKMFADERQNFAEVLKRHSGREVPRPGPDA